MGVQGTIARLMRRLCVFCGSSAGGHPDYAAATAELAERSPGRPWLVYGGASVGLMGVLADAALAAGGEVVGVIPQALVDREIAHPGSASSTSSAPCTSARR